jgi:RHS repeat-associated protein
VPGTCSATCVGDPINPGPGNVYEEEQDDVRVRGASPIGFRRFYNSADTIGSDMGPGWRHSYDRHISVNFQGTNPASFVYPGQSAIVSAQYSDPATACTSGFADIQGAVSAWSGASATYTNNVCVISNGGGTIGTLRINSLFPDPPQPTAVEYDVVRDDGQTFRYTTQGGSINNPPGVSLRFAVKGSGFTLTDDQDDVETYDGNGVLQSITTRSGLAQTLGYDPNGLLSSVTDSFGNVLEVSRNAETQIASVSVNGGGTVQFAYDATLRLTTTTNSDSTTHVFGYSSDTFSNALTSEVDESGATYATWNYDSQERALSSSLAGGADAVSLVYNGPNSTTVTDALGAVRTYSFGRSGDQMPSTAISGAPCPNCGGAAATTYDAGGWISSTTDYNGNVTCYVNDQTRGLELIRIEGFAPGSACPTNLANYAPVPGTAQRKISTAWSAAYRLPTLVTELTRTTSFDYDSAGNLLTKIVTDTTASPNVSRTWTYTYNSFGQILTVKGPRTDLDSTRSFSYYTCTTGAQCGQVQTVTDELSHVTTFNTYNAFGQPLTITDPNGVLTTLTYDARQRLTSRSIAGETTSFTYYPTGMLNKITLADSSFLQYAYDAAHRPTGFSDSLGNHVAYTLDAMGNRKVESVYDPSNTLTRTRSHVYNTLGELYQDIAAAGTAAVTTTYSYDPNGNETGIAAPLGRNSANSYDALNRILHVTDPANGLTQFSYDTNSELVSVTDPMSFVTSYQRDGFGDVVQQVSPDSGTTTKTYDSAGNVHTSTDANGSVTTYSYDARNRVTQATAVNSAYGSTWPGILTYTYSYDNCPNGVGRLCSATSLAGTMSWAYTAQGRLASRTEIDSWGDTGAYPLTYAYNSMGQITSLTYPSGAVIGYTYNGNHQIASISITVDGATTPVVTNVQYEPFGDVSGWTWGNGATVTRAHDEDGNVTAISSVGLSLSYVHDGAMRVTQMNDLDNSALSWMYGYDLLDRLTSASNASITDAWTYDANGNRLSQTGTNPMTYTYSSTSNRVATYSMPPYYGNYYPNGDLALSTATDFSYDAANNLFVTGEGYQVVTNALRQHVSDHQSYRFLWDDAGRVIGEYVSGGDFPDQPNSVFPQEETVYLGDLPIATILGHYDEDSDYNYTGVTHTIYYVHPDHLNTPRRVTQPSTNVIAWRWDSDPFGNGGVNPNPTRGPIDVVYDLRFPGQLSNMDSDSVFYNGFRDYDPSTGRYIESDPIGLVGGINTYAYVRGNPVSLIDPLGLGPWGGLGGDISWQEAFGLSAIQSVAESSPLSGIPLPNASISATIPTGRIDGVPTVLTFRLKQTSTGGSCTIGWGAGVGKNISMRYSSSSYNKTVGDPSGLGLNASYSLPLIGNVIGGSGNYTYYANGAYSMSGGPATVGGEPSGSINLSYTVTW